MKSFKDFLQRAKNTAGQSLPKNIRKGISSSIVFGRNLGDTGNMRSSTEKALRQLKKGPISPMGKNEPTLFREEEMESFKKFLNAKTFSPEKLAKKHKVPVSTIVKAVKAGTKVEKEHTKHKTVAKEIATDHVGEDPKYYEKLKKIEK